MPRRVTVRDRGYNRLMRRLQRKNSQAEVTVGVHDDAGSHGDGASVAEIAAFHELGLGVPERSWLGGWVDENEAENKTALRQVGKDLIKGRIGSVEQGLERFGHAAVGGIQQRISDGIEPELADSTVAQKGSSTPLIDKGTLRTSITHKVTK